MKIVVLDGYAANPGDLSWDEVKSLGECVIYDRTAPDELLERAAGAEIVLTNKVEISAVTMEALPELKYIGVMATGYNIVDVAAAKERGVIVTNIPAYSTNSVAQMVFAHILNITQQVQYHSEKVRQGKWTHCKDFCFWDTPLVELQGKKIGIVGLGHTGYATACIALGFGMEVYAFDPFMTDEQIKAAGATPLHSAEEMYSMCDYVSLHIPATEQTKKSINYDLLNRMPKGAVLVNTARKEIINEEDLVRLMAERPDFKYISDIAPDNAADFAQFEGRYFFTPKKMGAQTEEANINAGLAAARQIVAYLEHGDAKFKVNK